MVFGSASPGVSVRSGALRTRQSPGRLDEQLVRLLGRSRWPGFVAAPFWRAWPSTLRRSVRVPCSFRVDAPLDPVHSSASPDRIRAVCPDPHAPMLPLAPMTPGSTGERPIEQPPPLVSFTTHQLTNCSVGVPTRLFIAPRGEAAEGLASRNRRLPPFTFEPSPLAGPAPLTSDWPAPSEGKATLIRFCCESG